MKYLSTQFLRNSKIFSSKLYELYLWREAVRSSRSHLRKRKNSLFRSNIFLSFT